MGSKISFLLLFSLLNFINGEKILFFHHVASYSHRVQTWPLAQALQARGHEVYYISPFHPKKPNPNISELVPVKMANWVDEFLNQEFEINLRVENRMGELIDQAFAFGYGACEALLTSDEFKDWLQVHKKFDLVVVDQCLSECGIGLAYKLSAKYLIFSTLVVIAHEYDAYGFLPESSAVQELELGQPPTPFDFFGRFKNALWSLRWRWAHYRYLEKIDSLLRDHLKISKMPYMDDMLRNVSLIFYTGDVITDYLRSLPPLYVNVAGIHCEESKTELPKDIADFIGDGKNGTADDGFVYISLGSLVVSSNLPQHIKQIFFDTIEAFPNIKFLWKWNGDFPAKKPKNLFLRKWYPQVDILGHPKIKAFVTQNGRPSTLEGLFNGVPMISFPILGDQEFNSHRISQMGASVKLEIATVTVEEFKEALKKVLYDEAFKARVKRLQKIFKDRPMSPVETGVWYTEYVLRNDDTSHLKPAGSDQYWFIRRQIDVWGLLSIISFVLIIGAIKIISGLIRQISSNKKQKKE